MNQQRTGRACLGKITAMSLALLLPALTVGCLSLSFGGGGDSHDDSPHVRGDGYDGPRWQGGSITLHKGEELDVYYPVPYASPPNLKFKESYSRAVLVEQKADHFRVRNSDSVFDCEVNWAARGVRAVAPVAVVVPASSTVPVAVEVPHSAALSGSTSNPQQ